jgi:hypothetical protein
MRCRPNALILRSGLQAEEHDPGKWYRFPEKIMLER